MVHRGIQGGAGGATEGSAALWGAAEPGQLPGRQAFLLTLDGTGTYPLRFAHAKSLPYGSLVFLILMRVQTGVPAPRTLTTN